MLKDVQTRIHEACKRAGRDPNEVTLIAVTKGHNAKEIQEAVLGRGHRLLGENRVQEWRDKNEQLVGAEWHFIGNLQSNKVKYCTDFSLIHSLNSIKLADTMQKQGVKQNHIFRVMMEVNVAGEDAKQGVAPAEAEALLRHTQGLTHVEVCGLMTMAPYAINPENARPYFRKLRELRDKLGLEELSMGMSGDFEVAIEEGASFVRVGSAIFAPAGTAVKAAIEETT